MSALEELFALYWKALAQPDQQNYKREYKAVPGRKFLCDFVWVNHRVVVEIDGGQWKPHGGRHNTDTDREKHNLLTADGWLVFHLSGTMLKREPQRWVDVISQAIVKRSRTAFGNSSEDEP